MARKTKRLTVRSINSVIARAKDTGEKPTQPLHDGGGLYLDIESSGAAGWLYRYMLNREPHWMGLGSYPPVLLAEARERRDEADRLRRAGVDPISHRKTERAKAREEAERAKTFKQRAEAYITAHEAEWRNPKHRQQWKNTLATFVYPLIGELLEGDIGTDSVLKVLQQPVPAERGMPGGPLWTARPETAKRLRQRIERILNAAAAAAVAAAPDVPQRANPARWKGHLDQWLAAPGKIRRVRHHPALPYAELPAFMAALREQEGIAAQALKFTILTGARTNETIGARPDEFNIDEKAWTVPAERMKADREHKVPLSDAALAIVKKRIEAGGDYLFPGRKRGRPLSNMAMLELMRDMKRADGKPWSDKKGRAAVPHGFRSSFRDWTADKTNFENHVAEMALAHTIDAEAEAAYRRGDLFEKRRRLMDAWARYITEGKGGAVVPFRAAPAATAKR